VTIIVSLPTYSTAHVEHRLHRPAWGENAGVVRSYAVVVDIIMVSAFDACGSVFLVKPVRVLSG
jgi:hypothetical protein